MPAHSSSFFSSTFSYSLAISSTLLGWATMPSLTVQYVPVSSRHGGFLYWDWFSPLDPLVQVLGSDLVPRPDLANLSLSLPMVTHTTEDAITTNCTNVLTYKRNTLRYIRCYERSLLQKERLLQKDQCHNLQKVHFVLQKDTPGLCHQFYERPIWRRHATGEVFNLF